MLCLETWVGPNSTLQNRLVRWWLPSLIKSCLSLSHAMWDSYFVILILVTVKVFTSCGTFFLIIFNMPHLSQPIFNNPIFLIYINWFDRDLNVQLLEEWLVDRNTHNDTVALSNLFKYLEESKEPITMRNFVNRPANTSAYVRKKHRNQISVGTDVM